jgi:2-oxoglutarate dehydrogenase complex dehydrogenase (E1) component-like enzyme
LSQPVRTDLSELIAENFGANATYVEGLLSRFRSNPELVDESWRAYFAELLGDGDSSGTAGSTPGLDEAIRITENGGRTAST